MGGLQCAQRLFGKVNLGIAFIRSNHEPVAVGQLEQFLPFLQRHHASGRVSRRTHVNKLGALPDFIGQLRIIQREVVLRHVVQEPGRGARQVCRAFINLVERVGADHDRGILAAIDNCLCKREQRFAAAVHRQDLGAGIGRGDSVACGQPVCYRAAQRVAACRCGIICQSVQIVRQRVADKLRRGVFWFADGQADGTITGVWLNFAKQCGEFLERVGLQSL